MQICELVCNLGFADVDSSPGKRYKRFSLPFIIVAFLFALPIICVFYLINLPHVFLFKKTEQQGR